MLFGKMKSFYTSHFLFGCSLWVNSKKGSCSNLVIIVFAHDIMNSEPCGLLCTKGTNDQKVYMPFLRDPKEDREQASQLHIPVDQRN